MSTSEAQHLLMELMAWKEGQNLRPLLRAAIDLMGSHIVLDLPWNEHLAREKLIDQLEDTIEVG